ncbi:hypothetical protein [Ammonifex degensii]
MVARAAEATIAHWGLSGIVDGQAIAFLIADGAVYWEKRLPDGFRLALVRLHSPVVQREEVFLGSVLLNDFLSKTLLRAINGKGLGRLVLLVNDLENFYYLYHGKAGLEQMAESLRHEFLHSLEDLYFADEDPSRGVYGEFGQMFNFEKSDFEPSPVYSIPNFLARPLEKAVRMQIERFLEEPDFSKNIRRTLAALSFFYGQTSGGSGDAQSSAMFLFRLASVYEVIPKEAIMKAFGIRELTKEAIKKGLDVGQFSPEDLRNLLKELLSYFRTEIERGNYDWLLGFIRKDRKLIEITPEEFLREILTGVQIGYKVLAVPVATESEINCRLCGVRFPRVRDRFITLGVSVFRFHNKSVKNSKREEGPNTCSKCALSTYLQHKVLGSEQVSVGGKFPQLPRQYNVVFHYGRHDETEAYRLAKTIDYLLEKIAYFQQCAREEKVLFSVDYIRERLVQQGLGGGGPALASGGRTPVSEDEALAALLADDAVLPGLDAFGYMDSAVKTRVIPLGTGDYRLLVFVLPPFRSSQGEALDFVQRRFSRSRLAAFTLLALLRKLCGCDGPYYFQSVPRLAPEEFNLNTFYVRGRAENADEVIRRFNAVVNFARRVVNRRKGHSLLVDWILLAERLEEDPLGTFSKVLRRTPMRRRDFSEEYRDKFEFRPLAKYETIDETGVIDGTEYLKLIELLKRL